MAKATARTVIERPADEVWQTICRFGDLHWYHGVKSCTLAGDVRTVINWSRPNLEIDERVLHHDDAARTYAYVLTDFRGDTIAKMPNGAPYDFRLLIDHLQARISVAPLGEAACAVMYDLEMDEMYEGQIGLTTAGYQHCIDHLKDMLER
jgi:hypothetical protein